MLKILIPKDAKIGDYFMDKGQEMALSYYTTSSVLNLDLLESSFDLMSNPLFQMAKRADWMMPTPFVLNDAVIIKQKIKPSPKTIKPIALNVVNVIQKDSLGIEKDSLRKP
ncbi:hypothetical protein C3L50_05360 [Flavobacterium alvei]|uniref:Uncharacterized protein n=1 Tax=Flavobacterium alvei TaxID=2080416 RepID=A0A2S5ABY1_9FLAO|nr:hypothetical protein [Flavobacterium alvei]POY40075.1 hypothetical protein C3L50_05360 [Flavobacterium alvei]